MAETPTKPPFDVKALADVANRVSLDSVTLLQIKATRGAVLDETKDLTFAFEYRTAWKRVNARPGIDVTFELDARLEQPDGGERKVGTIIDASISFVLSYELPEVPPDDWNDRLALFARVNAPVNAWPYARAELQSLFVKMDLPAIMLPVYRPGRATNGKVEYGRRKVTGAPSTKDGEEETTKT